jgi:hypothetical protein
MTLALTTTVESLGERAEGTGSPPNATYFGLTLSAGITDAAVTQGMAELLRSWRWTLHDVAVLDADTLAPVPGARVDLLDVHAPGAQPAKDDLASKEDGEHARLVEEMERRWRLGDALTPPITDPTLPTAILPRFLLNPTRNERAGSAALDDGREELSLGDDAEPGALDPDSPAARPWAAELANASAFPYPYAQWLNLAVHFRVVWADAARPARIVCAPAFTAAVGARSFRYDPAPARPTGGTGDLPVRWGYVQVAGSPAPDAVAICGPAPVAVPGRTGALRLDSLWVARPRSGSGVFGTAWLAALLPAAAETFDLAARLMEVLRGRIAGGAADAPELRAFAGALWDPVVAALRDRIGTGAREGPDGHSLLEEWGAERPDLQAVAVVVDQAMKGADRLGLDEWKAMLRNAVGARLGEDPEVVLRPPTQDAPARETLARLERVVNATRDMEVVAALLVAQWNRTPGAAPHAEALRRLASDERTPARLRLAAAMPLWKWWLSMMRLNETPEEQRRKLRDALGPLLKEAAEARFGTSASGLPELAARTPRAVLDPTWLKVVTDDLAGQASREAGRLVPEPEAQREQATVRVTPPTGAQAAARTDWQRATPVPHPLAFELGVVQPDQPEAPGTTDALRLVSGFGVLLRTSGTTEWRSLNFGVAAHIENVRVDRKPTGRLSIQTWGKRPLLQVLRPAFQNGASDATVSYSNNPLTALSPTGIAGDHSLMGDDEGADRDRPAFHTVYAKAENFTSFKLNGEWANLVGLRFGDVYEALVYACTNSGALPPLLAASPDSPARIRPDPSLDPRPVQAKSQDLTAFIRRVWYPRRVAVGQARVNVSGSSTFSTPPVSERVSLRCRELFGRAVVESGPEGSFLLMTPNALHKDNPSTRFRFEVRRPATDVQTWLRWQQGGAGLADARGKVWLEYHTRLRDNHAGRPPRSLALDDPAVQRIGVVLLEFVEAPGEGGGNPPERFWRRCGDPQSWEPREGDPDGVTVPGLPGAARAAGMRREIQVATVLDGTGKAELVEENGTLVARVHEGRIYRLVVVGVCRASEAARMDPDYQIGWNTDPKLEAQFGKHFDAHFGANDEFRLLSPWTLWVEVATPKWALGNGAAKDVVAAVHGLLQPSFALAAAGPDGTYAAGGALTLSARLRHSSFPYLHEARLERQRWVWMGRPVAGPVGRKTVRIPTLPTAWNTSWIDRGTPGAPNDVMEWEVMQFGERGESEVVHHAMDSTLDEVKDPLLNEPGSAERTWAYTLDFTGDRGASYHRIALRVFHRYGALFGDEGGVVTEPHGGDRWRSYMVPYRPERAPERPSVRLVLPLTESEDDPSSVARNPGLIVQLRGTAFEQGGLAERIVVETVQTAPDPIQTAAPGPEALAAPRRLDVLGPIGHSFDPDGALRRIVTASYVIRPPGSHVVDGYFFKLRFGRTVNPDLLPPGARTAPWARGEVEDWNEGHWAQMLPDVRFTQAGGQVKNLRMRRGAGQKLLTLENGRATDPVSVAGRRIFEPCLAVTERIMDAAGRPAEVYAGVYRRTGVGEWTALTGSPAMSPGARLRARLMLVQTGRPQLRDTDSALAVSEAVFWNRIFGAESEVVPGDRLRIAAIYPPINDEQSGGQQ